MQATKRVTRKPRASSDEQEVGVRDLVCAGQSYVGARCVLCPSRSNRAHAPAARVKQSFIVSAATLGHLWTHE